MVQPNRYEEGGYVLLTIMVLSMLTMLVISQVLMGLHTEEEAATEIHLYQVRNRWAMRSGVEYLAYRAMAGSAVCRTSTEWRETLMGPDGGEGIFHEMGNELTNIETTPTTDVSVEESPLMRAGLNWTYPGLPGDETAYQIPLFYQMNTVGTLFRLEIFSSSFGVNDTTLAPTVNVAKNVAMGVAYEFSITDEFGYEFVKRETIWPYP